MKLAITDVLPPPEFREELPEKGGWERVERELGTKLPTDYKTFIQTYGTGSISNFMMILNPFSKNRYVNLLSRAEMVLEGYRNSRERAPEYFKDNVYPEEHGILPFGSTDNGDVLYWRTIGHPDHWPVTVYRGRGSDQFDYNGTMSEFLVDVLTIRIVSPTLSTVFAELEPTFTAEHIP